MHATNPTPPPLMPQRQCPLPISDMVDSIILLCGEVRCQMKRYQQPSLLSLNRLAAVSLHVLGSEVVDHKSLFDIMT